MDEYEAQRLTEEMLIAENYEKLTGGGHVSTEFAVARFTSLGALDPTFGAAGVVTTSFEQADSVSALAIQADGKILAAGNSFASSNPTDSFALARYTAQ